MALLLCLFLIIINHVLAEEVTNGSYYHCYSTGNFSHGSGYSNYRDSFLYAMPNNIISQSGYDFSHSATTSPAPVDLYCLGLCRDDLVTSNTCSVCITDSAFAITTHCTVQLEVIAWGRDAACLVRCAPHQFPSTFESQPVMHTCNDSSISAGYVSLFDRALAGLTDSIAKSAAGNGSWSSSSSEFYMRKYFATGESKLGYDGRIIYGLGFCLPSLFQSSCIACLRAAANESRRQCKGKLGATIFTPSCVLRYELYRFYQSNDAPLPSPPLAPTSPSAASNSKVRKEGRHRGMVVISILAPVIALLTIVLVLRYILTKKQKHNRENEGGAKSTDLCLEFSLTTIRAATNDFSISNKLGRGGFGEVYKGTLANGQQIAVKRLAHYSLRGDNEFRNEVQLVAKLHHKNLIKLIGFCLGEKERILIYELALNGSLDHFLFDPIRRQHLNWEVRYGIIQGIARGMLYLHEESQLRIIHRDLKASNILLDESMTPKISDFGTARLFLDDKGSASKIVGTYGYMAPEYAKHGKMSVKIDVFSFGVLLLEIVCGQKNTSSEHLLSKAWNYWAAGKHQELIEPVLKMSGDGTNEITRCMHIALLCVQGDAQRRPNMNSVMMMLEDGSQELITPSKPAYFMAIARNQPYETEMDEGYPSRSLSSFSSANEISITQYPDPR